MDGWSISSPQEAVAMEALDRIGQALKQKGLSLEEMIESGREIRGEIAREKYGIEPNREDDAEEPQGIP